MANAEAEVRKFDPPAALSSPEGGAKDLRKIIKEAPKFLEKNGILALECGIGHPSMLKGENLGNKDFSSIEIIKDFSGRDRFLMLTRA